MFEGQPKGLYALALANTGERFGYYTMLAVFVLFLKSNFGWSGDEASYVYSGFLGLVYFLPLVGGMLADKFGYGKMVTTGISIMFLGYLLLALPLGAGIPAVAAMVGALLLISFGTGLFKGNLQVMVGDLYNAPEMAGKRDSAFSIFYMAINLGALFAPTAAVKIMDYAQHSLGIDEATSYHFAFAVACASLIVSIGIYFASRPTFRHVEGGTKKAVAQSSQETVVDELSPAETRDRIVALCLVFSVVIFFWMAFHQNGATLTLFADEFTAKTATGFTGMLFDVRTLLAFIVSIYAAFSVVQSPKAKSKLISTLVVVAALAYLVYAYLNTGTVDVNAPIFQQFNPCFVVGLTPVSLAVFGWLAKRGKEPSAPRKIAYGMLIAALGFGIILVGSLGLPVTPTADMTPASPSLLINTYLVLTFAELLLSPMGISFVSKVAPPKYKGIIMGGWFAATALGNFAVAIPAALWGKQAPYVVWAVLVSLCLLSFLFLMSQMKKLEKVA